ncbi:Marine sediment metagenome DNA, contig: S12H4_L01240 (Fragment) OS=marine sediment metagenome GN=S12H4_15080 PE=4 SV=1 [Gemmata massiliana]|uniref:Marine sediment metagenome DNA, contig: S12H4_L01240 n=1 Tax=Gemmata massiliana TaxID=1210884 RepID=A0A6P2D7U5_9BACT
MKAACAVLLVLGFGITAGCKRRTEPPPADPSEASAAPVNAPEPAPLTLGKRGTFTVGKSTTFVLGPIDSTGHIDYATTINDRLSKGVTAANNANVAIWNVIGPNPPGEEKVPVGFFEKMGMAAPPATGNYFIGVKQYAEKTAAAGTGGAALDATTKLSVQPWTANENAIVSSWLQSNAKPLAALRNAVKRTHYYNPLVPKDNEQGLNGTYLQGIFVDRELARALACRAMLSLGRGDTAQAQQDLVACRRLGRLVGRGATLIEGVVAIAIEQVAFRAEVALLAHGQLDARAVEGYFRDLFTLTPARRCRTDRLGRTLVASRYTRTTRPTRVGKSADLHHWQTSGARTDRRNSQWHRLEPGV